MLSKRIIRHIKWRLHLCRLTTATFTLYDKKTDKLVPPDPHYLFGTIFGMGGGVFFVFVHSLQLYLKVNPDEIPDEPGTPEDPRAKRLAMYEFATTVVAFGEIAVVLSILGINLRGMGQYKNIVYVYNEMFAYSDRLRKMLEERNISLDRSHKMASRKLEGAVYATSFCTLIVGVFVMLTCLHPLEPTHGIIREWLELKWGWHPKLAPILLLFQVSILSCANSVMMYGILAVCYTNIVSTVLDDLTVVSVRKRQGARTTLETRFYGDMDDTEIRVMYRTQRYLNERVNEIFGSVLISFHQVGMLACFAIMLFFFVEFQNVIWEAGPLACAVILSAMFTPLLICFYQSDFFGDLVDVSEDFMDKGMKIVPRKTVFRRFIRSCQPYYVEEAYPFFHYHKNTFLEFCMAGLDHAINLMLW